MSMRPEPGGDAAVTQVVELPAYSSAPFALVTPSAIAEHGWATAKATWFAEFPDALTDEQIDAAIAVAAEVGLRVDTRDDQDTLAAVRRWTTIVGAALALAIVAMSVGLIRGEAAGDVRTLTATGASPRRGGPSPPPRRRHWPPSASCSASAAPTCSCWRATALSSAS